MVVTAHFIDDQWHLQKRILSFTQISDHKGKTIGKCIEKVLLDWGIDRVFTITVDNASANNTAVLYVKRKLTSWHRDGAILDGKYLHLRCCAHIVNLIVNDGLKEMHDSVVAIRNAVKFVKSSPSRFNKFKKCVEHDKIQNKGLVVLDVPTRWNSTYLMLASALKFGSLETTNKLLIIAVVLDPRYKLQYVSYWFAVLYGDVNRDSYALVELYECYSALCGGGSVGGIDHVDEIPFGDVESDDSGVVECKRSNFDILTWWSVSSAHYLILESIAKDVFVMLISTVASESAFSCGE
ncbi:hypothetical protein EZV62_027230 [Acer yangbiense]|uniref:hAT-like transposase RNase-H fold domain-containing protein n=1 Tax=Acer yangbiense TaxID=1000413 RepID=A0A5C7GV06_9ROSI|nr:hypothetical protein EZV62_027230 [Acer yangbiense]